MKWYIIVGILAVVVLVLHSIGAKARAAGKV
jgi:hypothetical protein